MKAAELFIRSLENEGVEYIFGIPGEENLDVMDALLDSKIRFITTRHEQGAAFMADVYGRLTGRAGVCLATLGPGATNLITGVADANMDHAPLVAIAGQASTSRLHKESHQVLDLEAMFLPITKYATRILSPDVIPEIVRKAFKVAQTEKTGACFIEFPENIAEMNIEDVPLRVKHAMPPEPAAEQVERAAELIANAKKPIILAGNGVVRAKASQALAEFSEHLGIPVANTFMAKGVIPFRHPMALGSVGLQSNDYANCGFASADVIICIGYDMVEYHPKLWNPSGSHRIVHCDFIPSEIDEDYRIEVEVVGDLAHTLWMLNERVDAHGSENLTFDHSHGELCRSKMIEEFEAHKDDTTEGKIRPQKALWDARQVLGPDDLLLSDVGAHKMWIARYYQCHEPNTCLIPNGFCSMGFALPGAIAAHFVNPDRRTMAICGDAGFMMNIQEMSTLAQYKLPVKIFILNNQWMGMVRQWQELMHGKRYSESYVERLPDFVKLAESFGAVGLKAETPDEMDSLIDEMIAVDRPVIADVRVDPTENVYPMVPSGAAHNEMILGNEAGAEAPQATDQGLALV